MTQFVQLHMLVSYPPANPNRDDAGKPKTAMMGGANRMRISSQSLKRAWRTSSVFEQAVGTSLGKGTRSLAQYVAEKLQVAVDKELTSNLGEIIHNLFSKKDKEIFKASKKAKKKADVAEDEGEEADDSGGRSNEGQRAFIAADEMNKIDDLIEWVREHKAMPSEEQIRALRSEKPKSVDVAMFGRMLANAAACNQEAAVQVANALTVHAVTLEDDFFTAVDDLNKNGTAYMGETSFAAGLFYLYLCIDTNLLLENLQDDKALAATALESLLEAAATISPSGMQNRFGNRVRASYIRAERGSQQPRSLSVAFLKPVAGKDMLITAIDRLEETAKNMDAAYGTCIDASLRLIADAEKTEGSLVALKAFVSEVYRG